MEVKRRTVKTLVGKLSSVSEQTRTESLCELRLMSKNDPDSRPLIAEAGAIPYLSEILYSPSAIAQENATATLLNISISSREPLMSTRGLLDALSHALRNPESAFTAQSAAATVFSLLTVDSYRSIIGSKRDILYALVDIIKNHDNKHPKTIKDALKALFGVSLYPLNRSTLIELGVVPALFSLVVKDGRVGVVEDATAVIAQIAGCEEAGEAFRKVSGIGVLVDLLDLSTGSSGRTKENAVSGLLNMVQCGKKDVGEYVKEMASIVCNGISDVAENGSSKGKVKANELLKLIDAGGGGGGGSGFQEVQLDNVITQSS
uniref:U-box domain-containing protein 2 n=1 Tax=Erigeron canadensis TaxID=72917 RepID=UPI001CB8E5E8|nr:U-box domain-containing protein 2 [Erigeron canadensis]